MKFSTYEPAVNPNTLHNIDNVQQRVSRDLHVYGPQGGGEQWQALGQMAKIGLEMQQKAIDGKVMEANSEYNKLMSEGMTQLFQKKEGEALNITEDYDKLQKNVLGEVKKKYSGYIGWGTGAEAFNAYTMRDDATRRDHVAKYQLAQTEAYHETQFNNQLAECRNAAIDGGSSIDSINGALNRANALIDSRYIQWGDEKTKEQKRLVDGQIVNDAIQMTMSMGDYNQAEQLLKQYKQYLQPKDYLAIKERVHKQQEVKSNFKTVDDIVARCRDANGSIDLGKAFDVIDQMYGKDSVKPGLGGSIQIPETAGYEIGGSVSDTNLNDLTEKKLRLLDRDYYAKYGQHLHITSMKRNGDGSSWHDSGQAIDTADDNLENSKEARDWLIAQGEKYGLYALDEYEHPSEHATGGHIHFSDHGEALEDGNQTSSAYDPEKAEKLKRMVQARANEEIVVERSALRSIQTSLTEAAMNGEGNLSQLADQLAAGYSPHVYVEAQRMANGLIRSQERELARAASGGGSRGGSGGRSGSQTDPLYMMKLTDALDRGEMSLDEANSYVMEDDSLTPSAKKSAIEDLAKYEKGEGKYSYNWTGISNAVKSILGNQDSAYWGALWVNIKSATMEEIRDYQHEHNGEMPPQQWVIDMAVEKGMTVSVTKKNEGWFDRDTVVQTSKAALRSKRVELRSDNGDGTYNIALLDKNGEATGAYRVSADQLMEIIDYNGYAKDIIFNGEGDE
jgi:hypothetical protein